MDLVCVFFSVIAEHFQLSNWCALLYKPFILSPGVAVSPFPFLFFKKIGDPLSGHYCVLLRGVWPRSAYAHYMFFLQEAPLVGARLRLRLVPASFNSAQLFTATLLLGQKTRWGGFCLFSREQRIRCDLRLEKQLFRFIFICYFLLQQYIIVC